MKACTDWRELKRKTNSQWAMTWGHWEGRTWGQLSWRQGGGREVPQIPEVVVVHGIWVQNCTWVACKVSGKRADSPLWHHSCSDFKGNLRHFKLSGKVTVIYLVSSWTWHPSGGSAGKSLGEHFAKPKDTTVYMGKSTGKYGRWLAEVCWSSGRFHLKWTLKKALVKGLSHYLSPPTFMSTQLLPLMNPLFCLLEGNRQHSLCR